MGGPLFTEACLPVCYPPPPSLPLLSYLYVGEPDGCHVYPLGRMFKSTSDKLWALVSTLVRGRSRDFVFLGYVLQMITCSE